MAEPDLEQLTTFLKALADKTRLRILGLIADEERSVEELATALDLKEPTVSHHLSKLKECSLVTMRPIGTVHLYRLNQDRLSTLLQELSPGILHAAKEGTDIAGYDRKVLNSFFVEGRLKEIPAQLKKRQVILRRLLEEFEPDRRYPEKELNQILKAFHEDTATLRREFIGNRMMQRENGVYWRVDSASAAERPAGI